MWSNLYSQSEKNNSKWNFNGDFRFRIEQDWNSKKPNGSFRENRSRLRYRLRAGVSYSDKWYKTGFRLRTGNPLKQQDPQLTLGDDFDDFGTLPIGLEKAFFQGSWKHFQFSIGKHTFPFQKNNELFWSDNVFPEGATLATGYKFSSSIVDSVAVTGGHYILSTSNTAFSQDRYFQGLQLNFTLLSDRVSVFPAIYVFKNVPNIPDGAGTFVFNYSFFHLGSRFTIVREAMINLEFDFYHNFEDYNKVDAISSAFKDQSNGFVIGLSFGSLEKAGDWFIKSSYAYLEKYAAVDIMAQNDWARWDYSAFDSPDGRLTNLHGIELVGAYKIDQKINLVAKYYLVDQLEAVGTHKETGSRFRLDIDVVF